jgi:hypothetical protein
LSELSFFKGLQRALKQKNLFPLLSRRWPSRARPRLSQRPGQGITTSDFRKEKSTSPGRATVFHEASDLGLAGLTIFQSDALNAIQNCGFVFHDSSLMMGGDFGGRGS